MSKPTGLGLFGALGSSLSERVNRATAEISIYVDLLDKTFSPGGRPYAPRPSSASPESSTTMGNGGILGTTINSSQDSNNPSSDPESSPHDEMACDNCAVKFTLFKTKKICRGCKIHFCSGCMSGSYSKKICVRCKVLFQNPPTRADLMELRVKDLQRFIMSKNMSTKSCVEKKDLVELIIQIHKSEGGGSVSPEESSSTTGDARRGPIESKKNFPKNYVQSTHREEWINKHNLQSDEDVILDDFVVVNPLEEASSNDDEDNRISSSSSESLLGKNKGTESTSTADEETPNNKEGPSTSDEDVALEAENMDSVVSPPPPPQETSTNSNLSSTKKNNVVTSSPKRFSHQELVQLSEIETEDDLLELSVKQMKEILALNRVMFKGVIEKEELLKIVRRLWLQDKRNNEDKDTMDDEELCKICMDSKVDCVMLECGHMCTCISCGKVMSECPICRRYVVRVVKIFKA
ncbi:E3 ubiquitin-protein ligase RNF34 isoform X3 [Lepeophtheirus salmonis]|uniref:E3 ubiquitin-protein ligase RNF34 isoform X3 n=2 Tax=Lepeophtheirus salmonis TaxID=72036 RepID=UPI001AEB6BFF|nr:E3 ubiquitin-protein ligase rififylin-like isoform X3 [Lepeophtheirus salmonis]